MKSLKLLFGFFLFCLLLAFVQGAWAADISYQTLIPQNSDTELVIQHKAQIAQAKMANGNLYNNIVTTLTSGTVTITSGTTTIASGAAVTSGTTLLVTGTGVLDRVIVNQAGAGDKLVLVDGTNGSGTVIGTLTAATGPFVAQYNARYTTGLTIISTGTNASDVTISYR
jgi:X-X-X-Leu-X-X-Gly heptad repeat protein